MRTAIASTDRYSAGAIWFHWGIAALVIANLFIGLFHESLLDGVSGAMPLHKSIGLTVLVLTAGRIVWRLTHRPPLLPPEMPLWQRHTARTVHWGLYTLMLIMPLTGWLLVSNTRVPHPIAWFGLFQVPFLPVSRATSGTAHEAHGLLAWVMLALVVIHVAAALRHHLILRDSVLLRMWPARGAR